MEFFIIFTIYLNASRKDKWILKFKNRITQDGEIWYVFYHKSDNLLTLNPDRIFSRKTRPQVIRLTTLTNKISFGCEFRFVIKSQSDNMWYSYPVQFLYIF